jgi:hypothetical protein
MTIAKERVASESVISEIFTYSGIEYRLTFSWTPPGYTARAYCPYCGKGIDTGGSDVNQDAVVSQTKAQLHDHFIHCPMRNAERPPLGVKLT